MRFQLLLPQKVLLIAGTFLARAAVVDVFASAFLHFLFCRNRAAAVRAFGEIEKREIVFLHFLRTASLLQYLLHLSKKFLCDERLVSSLKNFRLVFHEAGVEDVLEYLVDVRDVDVSLQIAFQSNVLAPLCHLLQRVFSCRVHLEQFSHFRGFVRVHVNPARSRVVEVAERCKHGPDAIPHFLSHTACHVFAERIDIVFALAKRNLEHEESLRRWFKPVGRKFEGTNQAAIYHVNDATAIN